MANPAGINRDHLQNERAIMSNNSIGRAFVLGALVLLGLALFAGACSTPADTISHNLSEQAEHFEIERRVVFINGITDEYLLVIEGRCSIEDSGFQLEVTCRTGPGEYKKHFLGLSDNVTYMVEQIEGQYASEDHYRVAFRPQTLIPDVIG